MRILAYFKNIAALLMAIIIVSSCTKRNSEYANVIPSESEVVLAFDLKSMAQKSGFLNDKIKPSYEEMVRTIKTEIDSPEAIALYEKIMRNPESTGLALGSKVYFFTHSDKDIVGFVFEVAKMNNLKNFFSEFENMGLDVTWNQKDDVNWVNMDGGLFCFFNETTLLIIPSIFNETETVDYALRLMKQKKSHSVTSNATFNKMVSEMNDIGAYLSLDALKDESRLGLFRLGEYEKEYLKKSHIIGDMNFENGEVTAKFQYFTENKKIKNLIEKQKNMMVIPGDTFLKAFDANALAYFNQHLEGEMVLKNNMLKSKLDEIKQYTEKEGIDMEKIIKSFKGDMTFALTDINVKVPVMTCYAQMGDDYLIQIVEMMKNKYPEFAENIRTVGANKYSYTLDQTTNNIIYFGMTPENVLYVSNDEKVLHNLQNKVSNPLTMSPIISRVKDSYGYMVFNVDALMNSKTIESMLPFILSNETQRMLDVVKGMSHFEIVYGNDSSAKMTLVMKNNGKNTLEILLNELIFPAVTKEFDHSRRYNYFEDIPIVEEAEDDDASDEIHIQFAE